MVDTTLAPNAMAVPRPVRPTVTGEDWLVRLCLLLLGLYLVLTLVLPLYTLLAKSLQDKEGQFVGLANFARYFADPAMLQSFGNTIFVSAIGTAITLLMAFLYAYALTRTCMKGRGLFRAIALIPLLAPSLLPGLALVYLFGNQGIFKSLLFGHEIYGPIRIVMG